MRRTVIKRPIFIVLLAFVLGEVIAVERMGVTWIFALIPILVIIKIITKMQVSVFVVIFLFITLGFLISDNAITQREYIYSMGEIPAKAIGRVTKIEGNTYGWNLFLEKVKISYNQKNQIISEQKKKLNQLLITCETLPEIKIGNVVQIQGNLKQFESARNKGNFDAKKYYMSLGIYGKIEAVKITLADADYDFIRDTLFRLKNSISNQLNQMCKIIGGPLQNIYKDKSAIYTAVLLGQKSGLNPEIKELYSISGIAHVLAISGLHISFIGMLVYNLLRKRFKFCFSSVVSIILVTGFCIMSGLGIATVRAMIMFGLKLLGEVFGRKYDYLTAISLAGILLLLWNPFAILNSGFQMSFTAIVAIVLAFPKVSYILQFYGKKIQDFNKTNKNNFQAIGSFKGVFKNIKDKTIKAIEFSVTISIFMNPIIAYNYYQLPTYSFLLNIIVVPLMSLVIISGMSAIAVSFLNIWLGKVLILPGCTILEFYSYLCNFIGKLPFSNVIVGRPSMTIVVAYYIFLIVGIYVIYQLKKQYRTNCQMKEKIIEKRGKLLIESSFILKKNRRIYRKFAVALMAVFMMITAMIYVPSAKGFQVTFLDVGQGDAIFIRNDNGTNILIDGGSISVEQVGKYRIIPYLKSECVKKIEYAIVTHTDFDHISGLKEMIELSDEGGIRIKNLVLPVIRSQIIREKNKSYEELIKLAEQNNVKILFISKGDNWELGNVYYQCVHPQLDIHMDNINDYSTVLSITYGQFSMLLTGDVSSEQEPSFVDTLNTSYTILKVAHHGSRFSTDQVFLQKINPNYGIISVGEHNQYGHPSSEVLKRLRENGSSILRTDINGEITVTTDGKIMKIQKMIE